MLRSLAETLRAGVRATDTVCRYGGEEFCLLLSHANTEKAVQIAESLRQRIAIKKVRGITVTASFGVSCLTTQGTGARQLIDQADQALYAAKDSGRNQVVLWNDISTTAEDTDRCPAKTTDEGGQNTDEINIRAVRVLVAALAHRDPGTAAHSRQVADLCVALAKGFLSRHDCFVLEVAGQLHDIGKLGVPDSILYKPDALTEAELKTVHAHLRFGIETVAATCSSAQLTEILRARYACYGGNPEEPDLPTGKDIPPGARILAICDAFSAMVSPRPFRHAFTREKAFEELRRSAGTQFDPELVERFIEVLLASDKAQTPTASDVIASEAARR